MSDSSVARQKALLRERLRKTRHQQAEKLAGTASSYAEGVLSLCSSSTKVVAAYLPMLGEPPLRDALTTLHSKDIEILVPIVEKKRTLSWVVWSPDLEHPKSSFGIEEPIGERFGSDRFLAADLHLIPALAFGHDGRRLGQGGAFYDTLLAEANLSSTSYIGIVFEHEVLDAIPAESHDAQLHFVLTEKRLHRLG